MKLKILKVTAFLLLFYSGIGVLMHALFKLGLAGHYCNFLLFGEETGHLTLFAIPASFAAILFNVLKRKTRPGKLNLP